MLLVALAVEPFLKDLMDLFLSSSTSFATFASAAAFPSGFALPLLEGGLAPPLLLRPIVTQRNLQPARKPSAAESESRHPEARLWRRVFFSSEQ